MKYNFTKILSIAFVSILLLFSSLSTWAALRTKLIVVDPGVPEYSQLVSNLPKNSRVLLLSSNGNAFQQIADNVKGNPVSSIHIVSHAEQGAMTLSGEEIHVGNIAQYESALSIINANTADGSDMLLYGCDLAGGLGGESLLALIAEKTGMDLAGSLNRTGHVTLGGDWVLEYTTGDVVEPIAFSDNTLSNYKHTLSHWRGGSITWQPVELDGDSLKNDVEITVKTACALGRGCAPSSLSNPNGISSLTRISSISTAFSDYILEETVFTGKNLDPDITYFVFYGGGNRISLKNNSGGSWKIQTNILMKDGNLSPKVDLPILYEIPLKDSSGAEASGFSFSLSATDSNADKIRYRLATEDELGGTGRNYTNPEGISINSNTGLITWDYTAISGTKFGLYSAGFVAEDLDANGSPKSKSHVDLILDLQDKQGVTYVPDESIPESRNIIVEKGGSYSFTITGSAVDVSSLGNLQGALTEGAEGDFTFAPGNEGDGIDLSPGTYPITFEVRDTTGTATKSYLILNFIVPDPNAPAIANIEGDVTGYASTFAQQVDQNIDSVVTDLDNAGDPVNHLNNGYIRFNVTFADGQYETLGIKSDGTGVGQISRTDYEVFYEGVKIGDIDAFEDGLGQALRIDFDMVSIEAVQALVRNLTYTDTFVLRSNGQRNLSLFIEDEDGLNRNYSLFIDVQDHPDKPVNGAPVVVNNKLTIGNGNTVTISSDNLFFVDADETAEDLNVTATNISNGQFEYISNAGTAITSFTQADVDNGLVQFVHDGSNSVPTYSLTVDDGTNSFGPDAAAINFSNGTTDNVSVFENRIGVAIITDTNVVGTPSFAITGGADSASFNINAASGSLSFQTAPDYEVDPTSYVVEVTVTGSTSGTDVRTVNITLIDVNEAPSISGTNPTNKLDPRNPDSYSFTPVANDPELVAMTYSITKKPSWASFDTNTGELSGTPVAGDAGSYSDIQITASDGINSATLPPFFINVLDAGGNYVLDACYSDDFLAIGTGSLDGSWSTLASTGYTPQPVTSNGEARLRLTDAAGNRVGGVSKDFPIPSLGVSQFEFKAAAHGGTGADGIAIVLSDWDVAPVLGAPGGSLGYGPGAVPGFAGGWLGIGIDEFGNFSNYSGNPATPNSVALRGSGSGMAGYKFLSGTSRLTPLVNNNLAGHQYKVTIDSSDGAHAYVTVERDTGAGYVTLINDFDVLSDGDQATLPSQFRLSMAASTGGSTNNHELTQLRVTGTSCSSILAIGVNNSSSVVDFAAETVTFNIELNQPAPAGGVLVDYATTDGTAAAADEYTAQTGTLSFASGERSKTVVVNLLALDAGIDNGKEFYLQISNAINAYVGEATTNAVLNFNTAPVANAQSPSINEDVATAITLVATDGELDTLTYSVVTGPTNGTLSGTAPNLTYTPNANYFGNDSFSFKANDSALDSNTATVSITVRSVNDVPSATAQNVSLAEDGALAITLAGTDIDGTIVSYTVGTPSDGVLSGTAPNLTYTPNANFNGSDSFTFTVTDNESGVSTASTISISVSSVNDVPSATGQNVSLAEDGALAITLAGTDIDGTIVSYTVGTPSDGVLSGTAPNLTYTPNANFNGSDSFTFTVTDNESGVSIASTVSITVSSVNDIPTANSQSINVIENGTIVVVLSGSDVDGTVVSYSAGSSSNGVISGTEPNLTYTPNADFFGSDSFTFTVTDNQSSSSLAASISITVERDLDGDGTSDVSDTDIDGDGIPNTVEGSADSDGDSIPDDEDTDSDNDGIPDVTEGATDTDTDGTMDYKDIDSDNDGILDAIEAASTGLDFDSDGIDDAFDVDQTGGADANNDGVDDDFLGRDTDQDGSPDHLMTDSDNDGISDTVESGASGIDTDSDGIDDAFDVDQTEGNDANNDGIDDAVVLIDTDKDRTPDYRDTDSDNDGISDADEGVVDTDMDGMPDYQDTDSDGDGITDIEEGTNDTDNDGTPDYLDTDTDGDGILDVNEGAIDSDGDGTPNYKDTDSDNDGLLDSVEGEFDTDGDDLANYIDTDSDGDGSSDSSEGTVDTDNDGSPDYIDFDSDGDGIPDREEGNGDTDADGIPDIRDTDSDGDGIPDIDEGNGDTDGDGLPDYKDTDADGDGIGDQSEGDSDTNNDGTPDYKDTDSDGDGIPDSEEGEGDADGDGIPDATDSDSDGDGIPDAEEGGGDIDGDGIPDYKDADSDDDGIPDAEEGDGDLDNDGIPDYKDTDSDGDGILDMNEGTGDSDGDGILDYKDTDTDGDGVADTEEGSGDTDGDGIPNYLDTDADGDGIHDSVEGNGDTDNDGIPDFLDLDADGDGIGDLGESTADTDNDGIPNYLDLDSDGDNIPDTNEGAGDTDNDRIPNYLDGDTDGDGISDLIEGLVDTDNDGLSDYNDIDADGDGVGDAIEGIIDTDNDGTPNYLDLDSDGDNIPDATEGTEDLDGDGILDVIDQDADGDGISDAIEGVTDTDNDGTPNFRDSDSDGDGIPDSEESNIDSDTDTLANYLDDDSDADGISDAIEGVVDIDGDGISNYLDTDSDGDGLSDLDEGNGDADNDGIPDYLDTDSDNDGIPDSIEGTTDSDNDGLPDYKDTDSDNDGISDRDEGAMDSDNDGIPDYKDEDSDNDGISDLNEGSGDADNDGIPDNRDTDSDNDGTSDGDEGGTADTDNDGTPDYLDSSSDEDSDGIPDIVEGTGDSDDDGIPDYRDIDSDNDGIPDSLEQSVTISGIDTDNDGIDDIYDVDETGGADDNNDGVDDAIFIDSDNDGIPNYLDVDSDNDGVPDLIEAGNSGIDSDSDGIDDRLDVDITGGVDANGDGIDDARNAEDSDHDGIFDYLDLDSDNDGASDTSESQVTLTFDGTINVIDDADGDGIADVFDVDFTGGLDTNMDGIDDDVTSLDSDNDGLSDYLDLDSDNDGILDVKELGLLDENNDGMADVGQTILNELPDADNDGTPDLRDLDSDNDGTFDIDGSTTGILDADNDGRIDDITDADNDGILDVVDSEPGQRGTTQDADADGVPSQLDGDDDEDGIADSLETDADDDNDGTSNRLDRDSDGDGIPDRFEANRPDIVGIDSDFDGIDNAFDVDITGGVDADNDGIDDAFVETDVDNDGLPDYLDADTDGDGIPDNVEQMLVAPSGNDTDFDGIDDAYDVDATGGMDENNDGIDDAVLDLSDMDGDGILNFRDTDSDGDGYSDADENGDYNSDGVPDFRQLDPGLETALEGHGGGSVDLGMIFVGILLLMLRIRRLNRRLLKLGASLLLTLTLFSGNASAADSVCKPSDELGFDFPDCWYLGFGVGRSFIKPEDNNTGWEVIKDKSSGIKFTLGYRFLPHWFTELSYANLGDAAVENRNPAITGTEHISYKVPSIGVGYYLAMPEEENWSVFLKGGIASIQNVATASRVPFDDIKSSQFFIGAGVDYQLSDHWFARAEFDSYDKDAQFLGVSLNYLFSSSKTKTKTKPKPTLEKENQVKVNEDIIVQEPVAQAEVVIIREPLEPVVAAIPVVAVVEEIEPEPVLDEDLDGVIDELDSCHGTPKDVVVNKNGCPVFEGVLKGLQFETNSADLTSGAREVLVDVVAAMATYPKLKLEIQAHTDNVGSRSYNQKLSQRRAESVVEHLVSKGISDDRFFAQGFGGANPTASNDTEEGRSANRRVEFVVLAK